MLQLTMLPAKEGDSLWVEWGEDGERKKLLIDLGTQETGSEILKRIEAVEAGQREFEILVVTHVDRDHIGGTKSLLIKPESQGGPRFKDVWFNGRTHLEGRAVAPPPPPDVQAEAFGAADGEEFSRWLKKKSWNQHFGGNPICFDKNVSLQTATLSGGLKLTVIGPPRGRLTRFIPKWDTEIKKAFESGRLEPLPGGIERMGRVDPALAEIEAFGRGEKPTLRNRDKLVELAARNEDKSDDSHANGSSIALILEYGGKRILLAGDAFAPDLIDGIKAFSNGGPLELDAFKLPHHGSLKNVSADLIASVSCKRWLISTDGTRFKHPDASAIARILVHSDPPDPELHFNVRSEFNGWWANRGWQTAFNYQTVYGTETNGLTVDL